MKITKISNDFTPLRQGILFGIETETEEPTDLVVEIINSTSGEVVATQLLRSVIEAQVNIAPYIQQFSERTPSQQWRSTIQDAPIATHHIRIGNTLSESIKTSFNTGVVTLPSLVSTMPSSRRISRDERDELLLMVGAGKRLLVEIVTSTNDGDNLRHTTETGVAVVSFNPSMYDADSTYADIKISCDDELIGTLHYDIVPYLNGSLRLAWFSECGSIERYTLPAVVSTKRQATKQTIRTLEGRRVVRSSTEHRISATSRYEPRAIAEALAYIASSPKVWLEEEEGLSEVVVTTSTIDNNLFNEPDCVNLELLVWRREEVLC